AAEWNDRTFALVARTGTGKTSVAAHVVARGGVLVTDDVLALEDKDDVVMAHPGAASLSIDPAELRRMPPTGRQRLGPHIGRAYKIVLARSLATAAAPLRRIYFLERPSSGRLRIVPLAPDPVRLLAN